jgi:hypothetical protein
MRIQPIVLRLATLLVLLSAACDYCTFDYFDPGASMSQPGPVLFKSSPSISPGTAKTNDLPDDRCLGCSPGIAMHAVTVENPFRVSSAFENPSIQPRAAVAPIVDRPPRP